MDNPDRRPLGWTALDFDLEGVDGKNYSLADVRGEKGTVVVFMCNHCPYVKSTIDRIVSAAQVLAEIGVGFIGIMPNDTDNYPADSFDNMKLFAKENDFTFPYVIDTTQEIARGYGAVCTPDYFGFNAKDELQYRGRLDEARPNSPAAPDARHELVEAMKLIAETGQGPEEQIPSMGCSVKWR